MATIFNKRKHALEANGVTLNPGENTVDDQLWKKANSDQSQFAVWSKLNWISEKRSLPVAKDAAKPLTTFSAPTVDGPVSQEPGSDMNPSSNPAGPSAGGGTESSHDPKSALKDHESDESKRRRR